MLWFSKWADAIANCLDYIENNKTSTVTEVLLKVAKAEELIEGYTSGCRFRSLYDEMQGIGKDIEE